MSPEIAKPPQNELEERLFSYATQINGWVQGRNQRGSHYESTLRKLTSKLTALSEEFQDVAAYIQTPLLMLPMKNGNVDVGIGEATGEIVGFAYSKHPTINNQAEVGPMGEGVVAIVATGDADIEGLTADCWDQVIPARTADYKIKGVVPILIPIIEGVHFTQVDNSVPLHFNTSHLLTAETVKNPNRDYQEHVVRIESLMKGRYKTNSPELDKPLMLALHKELKAMNAGCSLLGQSVEVSAAYMRTPSLINPGGFTVLGGEVQGVLRKFVYGPYYPGASQPHLKARGTVQAVVYQPDTAEMVYSGELSPQEADKISGTIFIPLDQKHTISPID